MAIKNVVITGSGKYIPQRVIDHEYFKNHQFFNADHEPIDQNGLESAKKLEKITGIEERRYAMNNIRTSDMATEAAKEALNDSGIDIETLDQLIVAENFGDVSPYSLQGDLVPSLAARVKHNLKISNPNCVAYDIIFGCPGWLQGVIQSYSFINSGIAKNCLVIGAETLSRVVDKYDRDSMIYADGAGATIVQLKEEQEERGILSVAAQSYTREEIDYLFMDQTYFPDSADAGYYLKMHGRKIYEFALKNVPSAMKECFDACGKDISSLKKIFIHQANEKMDEAIIKRFYKLYNAEVPADIMPLSIDKLGNSSVATIPTVYDMVKRGELEGHAIQSGDLILFASVGAGMNINALTYLV